MIRKNIFIIFFALFIFLIAAYLIVDIYKLISSNFYSDQYAISKCPDGEKVRIKNISNIPPSLKSIKYERAIVTKIIDGDTIELGDCRVVRYLGIDTPETVHPGKPIECFGPEASKYNKKLVLGKKILLFEGKKDKDVFGRYLRYVVVADSGNFVNRDLVKSGHATVFEKYISDNNFEVYQDLLYSMSIAKKNKIGIWSKC